MAKIELIYKACQDTMMSELSGFWQGFEIDKSKLQLDTDQLQGIVIYIVSQMKYP
jgi:hypothetical protein